jgi:hypothetical protein
MTIYSNSVRRCNIYDNLYMFPEKQGYCERGVGLRGVEQVNISKL